MPPNSNAQKNLHFPLGHGKTLKPPFFFIGIWALYIFLSPFYLFPSGLPQPADIMIFVGIMGLFSLNLLNYNKHISAVYIYGAIFVGLTFVINLIHFYFITDAKFIFHSLYYFFNFCIFVYGTTLFSRYPEPMNRLSYLALMSIIFVQLFIVVFFPDSDDFRASGTFNRSNQLAYWCVLAAALLVILKRNERMRLLDVVAFCVLAYIQMLSLSKAGIVVFFVLFLIFIFSPQMPKSYRLLIMFCVSILLIANISNAQRVFEVIQRVETIEAVSKRLGTIGKQSDDTPEARGYLRLIEHPQYLFVGAGEGAYWRFGRQELHSGIATLIFSYSIFGFGFFILFLINIFYRQPWYYTAMLIPIFLYGLTHQNIRFSFFWVFLACSYVVSHPLSSQLLDNNRKKKVIWRQDSGGGVLEP